MGSYDSATMVGFICRLCSELNTNVIHIYSEKGKDMNLAEKINLMPISVDPHDSLPKTICRSCIKQLNKQYIMIQRFKRSREVYLAASAGLLRNEEDLPPSSSNSDSCDDSPAEQ